MGEIDLSKYRPLRPDEYSEDADDSIMFDYDPSDGRADLRRQAWLIEAGDVEDPQWIANPKITIEVAAAALGISQRQYFRLVDSGVLPSFPKGGVDLSIVQEAWRYYKGEARGGWSPATGARYEFAARRKVY